MSRILKLQNQVIQLTHQLKSTQQILWAVTRKFGENGIVKLNDEEIQLTTHPTCLLKIIPNIEDKSYTIEAILELIIRKKNESIM